MIRTYKRKLILSKAQQERLSSWIGACRIVYNAGLEIKMAAYRNCQQSIGKYELMKQLTEIKDIDWIADVPSQSLQAVMDRLDNSYKNFFRSFKIGGGFPKFAAKRNYKSISYPNRRLNNNNCNRINGI